MFPVHKHKDIEFTMRKKQRNAANHQLISTILFVFIAFKCIHTQITFQANHISRLAENPKFHMKEYFNMFY